MLGRVDRNGPQASETTRAHEVLDDGNDLFVRTRAVLQRLNEISNSDARDFLHARTLRDGLVRRELQESCQGDEDAAWPS